MNKRIADIDLGAGIMILWMIIYHALPTAWSFQSMEMNETAQLNPCELFPYLSFFMPWFFYKSGQFFMRRPMHDALIKDSRKLLLSFAVWSAIGYAMYLLFGAFNHTITLRSTTYSIVRGLFITGKIPVNEPLWFLLTLFGVRFVANLLLPNREEKYGWNKVIVIVCMGYILAYCCYLWNHPLLPYWVANGASGLAFFALGYGLRNYEDKWWIIAPCTIVYVLCCIIGFPMVDMMFNKLLTGSYLLWMPIALCGIVTFNTLCKFICKHVRIIPLEYVGQNAMTIYVTHILIVTTIAFILRYWEISVLYPYAIWIIMLGYLTLLPLFCVIRIKYNHNKLTN